MENLATVPVWVLNLKRDEQKLHFMQMQLNQLEVDFRVIEAVDGRQLKGDALIPYSKKVAVRDFGRELTPGEIGCALSHIKMWQMMIQEGLSEVLILEDDVHIGYALFDVLKNRHKFPSDYQHINFSTNARQIPFGDFITDIYRVSRHAERPYLTSAYLLTLSGAKLLLDLVDPLYMPIDNYVSISNIVSYGIYPRVVVLSDIESSIGKRWDNMPKPGFLLRKFQQFKDILKAIAIFLGFSPQMLVNIHLKINHIFERRTHED